MKYRVKRQFNKHLPQRAALFGLMWDTFPVSKDKEYPHILVFNNFFDSEDKRFETVRPYERGRKPTDDYGRLAFDTHQEALDFIAEWREWKRVDKTRVIDPER